MRRRTGRSLRDAFSARTHARTHRAELFVSREGLTVERFYSTVAGASKRNEDGSDRQSIIRSCAIGETLHLIPDQLNAYSAHAIRVVRANGQQLGYLPDDIAERLTVHMLAGGRAWA